MMTQGRQEAGEGRGGGRNAVTKKTTCNKTKEQRDKRVMAKTCNRATFTSAYFATFAAAILSDTWTSEAASTTFDRSHTTTRMVTASSTISSLLEPLFAMAASVFAAPAKPAPSLFSEQPPLQRPLLTGVSIIPANYTFLSPRHLR